MISNKNNCSNMFEDCDQFNLPVVIGYGVNNCSNMFRNCRNFNQPVVMINNVYTCSSMFINCNNFNQSITIFNVYGCREMFCNCYNFSGNVYIRSNKFGSGQSGMFYGCYNNRRKNLFVYKNMSTHFNSTVAGSTLVYNEITWTTMTNGYYNAAYNIYVYTNLT